MIGGGDSAGMGDRGVRGEGGADWAKLHLVLLLVVSGAS